MCVCKNHTILSLILFRSLSKSDAGFENFGVTVCCSVLLCVAVYCSVVK